MLQQGQAVIEEFRGEAENIVGEARATAEELRGLWDWAKGLYFSIASIFGVVPPTPQEPQVALLAEEKKQIPTTVEAPAPVRKKQKQRELSYEEYKAKAIHDVCTQLKVFFEAQRQLKLHCRELEEQSLTTDRVADSAIDRIEIETQLLDLSRQIREAMQWTPEYLGLQDMYKRFLQMYDLILEEQEFERQRNLRNARNKRWLQESRRNLRVDVAMWAMALAVVVSAWWWAMFQVASLSGYSLG